MEEIYTRKNFLKKLGYFTGAYFGFKSLESKAYIRQNDFSVKIGDKMINRKYIEDIGGLLFLEGVLFYLSYKLIIKGVKGIKNKK